MRREEEYVWEMSDGCAGYETKGISMESIEHDLTENGLSGEVEQDRAPWGRLVQNVEPT